MSTVTMPVATGATPEVAPARDDRAEHVLATLTLAFATDPPCRWMLPEPAQYLRHFPAFARALGGQALAQGTALCSPAGAALWLRPGDEPDETALAARVQDAVHEGQQPAVFALFDEMARWHPHEPHWYLPMIGVEPTSQGCGHGAALMRPVLAVCDAAGVPAYLEATSARSRRLYERLGFKPMGCIEVADCPPIVPMLRRPR